MITRKQYINAECSHETYYNQFITDSIKKIVIDKFGIDRLKIAYNTGKYFNSMPLQSWDNIAPMLYHNRDLGILLDSAGDYMTLAGAVCILKQAAAIVVNESEQPIYKTSKDFNESYDYITDSQNIYAILDYLGLLEFEHDITAIYALINDGDYSEVWLTESNRWYEIGTKFYPLSYYKGE